jgi:transmembrane sensor
MKSLDKTLPASGKPAGEQDALSPYAEALRAHFPSREALLQEAIQQTQRRRRLKQALATSACCLLAAVVWYDPVWSTQRMQTAIGQSASFQLQDGSTVSLNTNTLLIAEQHLRSRQLRLAQGEALFSVKHAWQPFTVAANQVVVRDIGTVFNLRNTAQGATVTVIEGSVDVITAQAQRRLTQHLSVTTTGASIAETIAANAETVTAWQQGRLIFDGQPLSEVVAELQRYHAGPIIVADARAAQYRLSGEYDIHGIDALLAALPEILPVRVEKRAEATIVIRQR